ncbi:conjugal transfer protein TraN [Cysteiniphilum sp. QT6929]|uniref:conjugal transfer protein TraN n=1 Tax=Cysteiniphilum sp. QT6929 TaxID=2975055 RepID=UPI0024B33850|nr:conjugal transfer protein TraN [Cysteiniphilum sp. QT6929]WHN66737.1 conjugal transfer protein TraN [Cysteiniphilum sp. QT6929]
MQLRKLRIKPRNEVGLYAFTLRLFGFFTFSSFFTLPTFFTLSSLLSLCNMPMLGFAHDMQQRFDQTGASYANASKEMIQSGKLNNQINPQNYTNGDMNDVPEKAYRENPEAIDVDKQSAFAHNPQANAIVVTHNTNKHRINPNNPAYQKAVSYQDNAEQILRDNGYDMQCKEVSGQSKTQTTTQHCRMSNHQMLECFKYPQVEIIDVTIPTRDIPFSGTGATDWRHEAYHSGAHFTFPYSGILKSFHITSHGNWMGHFWIHIPPIVSTIDTTLGTLAGGAFFRMHMPQTSVSYAYPHLAIPVTQGQQGQLSADGREYAHVPDMTIEYHGVIEVPAVPRFEARVHWVDNCQNIDPDACVNIEETCIEAGGVRHIGGVDVDLPCWKYHKKYKCGFHKINACEVFEDQCNFVSQRCVEQVGHFCITYEKSYHCVEENAGDKELICGNPNSIQFKQKIERGTTADFLKAVSGLAGAAEAGKELKDSQDQLQIFKGDVKDCGEAMAGLYDCCDGGGGIFHHCSDQEKELQGAKEKRLATFAGRYCAKKVLGVCILHHQTWCVFGSKISRIIQEQGRRDQLGIGFGSGEHPNCSGMTPEQLQQLDFRRIDFREIYQDIQNKAAAFPDDRMGQTLEDKFGGGKSMPEVNAALPKVE